MLEQKGSVFSALRSIPNRGRPPGSRSGPIQDAGLPARVAGTTQALGFGGSRKFRCSSSRLEPRPDSHYTLLSIATTEKSDTVLAAQSRLARDLEGVGRGEPLC